MNHHKVQIPRKISMVFIYRGSPHPRGLPGIQPTTLVGMTSFPKVPWDEDFPHNKSAQIWVYLSPLGMLHMKIFNLNCKNKRRLCIPIITYGIGDPTREMNFILEHGPLLFFTLEERKKIPPTPPPHNHVLSFRNFFFWEQQQPPTSSQSPPKKPEIFGLSKLKRTLLLLLDTSSMWWMKYFATQISTKLQAKGGGGGKKREKMNQEESKTKLDSFIIGVHNCCQNPQPHMTQSGDQNVCFQNTLFCT